MKNLVLGLLFLPFLLAGATIARAQVIVTFPFDNINAGIPDGDLSGLVDSRSVTMPENSMEKVTVNLTISGTGGGAYNGDLYVYLQHDPGFAVLLNRPGRSGSDSLGYSDNGFSHVTLDDSASYDDVHTYRLTLLGSATTPLPPAPSPLTGVWASDGRDVAPGDSFDTTPRTATLERFDGLNPNGVWNLFLADTEVGGTARLDSWSMTITAIPEPRAAAWWMSLPALGFAAWRQLRGLGRAQAASPGHR